MEVKNNISQNSIPNLQFYKKIFNNVKVFDIFIINNKDKSKNNFSGIYLALGNSDSNDLYIYKINSKDNIKLIHTIKIECENINVIKYYNNPYTESHYLTALINNRGKIIIYEIIDECKYNLIFEHIEIKSQGGYSMSKRPLFYRFYELMFNKEESFLILYYVVQRGCCYREANLDLFDFIKKEKYRLKLLKREKEEEEEEEEEEAISEGIKSIIEIKRNEKTYLSFLNRGNFYLYYLSTSNLILVPKEDIRICGRKKKQIAECIKIKLTPNLRINQGFFLPESNGEEYLYLYQDQGYYTYYSDGSDESDGEEGEENEENALKRCIYKLNIKNNQLIYLSKIKTTRMMSMLNWNEKYLIIFEDKGKKMLLFNKKTARVEKAFNKIEDALKEGKKITINNSEELLFINSDKGILNIWINSKN